jgi:hypothetical protein
MSEYQLKYLDQGNLANAYVSGMQEDLKMYGNQYTYAVRTSPFVFTLNTKSRVGYSIHLRLCSDANSFNINHPENSAKLLACLYGNRLGSLHICSSWDAERDAALRIQILGWILRELVLSLFVVRTWLLVSLQVRL